MKEKLKRIIALLLAGAMLAGVAMTTMAGCELSHDEEEESEPT